MLNTQRVSVSPHVANIKSIIQFLLFIAIHFYCKFKHNDILYISREFHIETVRGLTQSCHGCFSNTFLEGTKLNMCSDVFTNKDVLFVFVVMQERYTRPRQKNRKQQLKF